MHRPFIGLAAERVMARRAAVPIDWRVHLNNEYANLYFAKQFHALRGNREGPREAHIALAAPQALNGRHPLFMRAPHV
jgi:hypothetical protein